MQFDPAPAGFTFVIDTLYLYKNTLAAELRLATRWRALNKDQ